MTRVNFIFTRLLQKNGDGTIHVGGVETYILRLSRLLADLGHDAFLFQQAERPFRQRVEGLTVIGVAPASASPHRLYQELRREDRDPHPVVIFCAEQIACYSPSRRSVLIQNGVYWDLPNSYWTRWKIQQWPGFRALSKFYTATLKMRQFDYARLKVCVDLNFVNWYRTVCDQHQAKGIYYIPNCCTPITERECAKKWSEEKTTVTLLFARRFQKHRGTRLFGEVAPKLLREFKNLQILIVGEGPDEVYFKQTFGNEPRVRIEKFSLAQLEQTLKWVDISVVPSIASEGTSFSVAEAMGSACCVVASNVGGITNMIIPEFNGILVWPTPADLHEALREILLQPDKRRFLARNAWEVARRSFSEEAWRARWSKVIEDCVAA